MSQAPVGGYGGWQGGGTGRGRVSPARLTAVFLLVLVVSLAIGAAVILAVQPAARKPKCPDPAVPCGQPPVAPTLPTLAARSPAPAVTPAPTIVRPSGGLASQSVAPSTVPASTVPASTVPAPAAPSVPPLANLPKPQPASHAGPLRVHEVWSSNRLGFSLEYDSRVWEIQDDTATSLVLAAANGNVLVSIEGVEATAASPIALLQQKVNSLGDVILGLTEETDPARQLPGTPIVGHRQGLAVLMNGTINTPQGPAANVDVVVLAATDGRISLRVTLLAADDLRDPAFAVADSILNSIEWPAASQ